VGKIAEKAVCRSVFWVSLVLTAFNKHLKQLHTLAAQGVKT